MGGLFVLHTGTVERFAMEKMGIVVGAGELLKPALASLFLKRLKIVCQYVRAHDKNPAWKG